MSRRPAVQVDTSDLRRVAQVLRSVEDGKELRKQLIKDLKSATEPAVAEARSAVMAIPARGTAQPALRATVARKIGTQVKLSGRSAGVSVRARKTPNLRGFKNAPKKLQQRGGWRHPVYGRGWTTQQGRADWFDEPMQGAREPAIRAVKETLNNFAQDLARRLGR